MSPLDAAVVVALVALPFHFLLQRECDKLCDPRYLRAHGVVITHLRALDDHAAPIGSYMGQEVWESVRFMGMTYRFSRIVPRAERDRLAPGELFLEPGLVYVTE